MIELFTGTPGSGKSLHANKRIYYKLNYSKYKNVIANFKIKCKMSKRANFNFLSNEDLHPNNLIKISQEYHEPRQESQTLLVIDEAQLVFNSRNWNKSDRFDWIQFFSQHRKLGFDVILVTQFDEMIDKQIRVLCEYNVIHRKLNNYKIGNLLPVSTFIAVTYWIGINEKQGSQIFFYRKKYGEMYDTYAMFDLE